MLVQNIDSYNTVALCTFDIDSNNLLVIAIIIMYY